MDIIKELPSQQLAQSVLELDASYAMPLQEVLQFAQ